MWHLCAEFIVLALCDKDVDDSIKQAIADKLMALFHQYGPQVFTPGKPDMPTALLNRPPHEVQLVDFVDKRSWLIFQVIVTY